MHVPLPAIFNLECINCATTSVKWNLGLCRLTCYMIQTIIRLCLKGDLYLVWSTPISKIYFHADIFSCYSQKYSILILPTLKWGKGHEGGKSEGGRGEQIKSAAVWWSLLAADFLVDRDRHFYGGHRIHSQADYGEPWRSPLKLEFNHFI